MEKAIIQKQVQIVHPEKVYPYLPNITDNTLAPLFGLTTEEYRSTKALFASRAKAAGELLLADPDFSKTVERLPFKNDDVILVLGESNTDDYQSWFEIMKCIIKASSPANIQMINAAVSGQTTSMALRNLTTHLQVKPTWVICMLGMNDALRIGGEDGKTVVSFEETCQNLDFMRQLAKQICNPQWIWITPYTVDEKRQDENKWFQGMRLKWNNRDLVPIHQYMLTKNDSVIDVKKIFEHEDLRQLLMEDGVHASILGHREIVKELFKVLAERQPTKTKNNDHE